MKKIIDVIFPAEGMDPNEWQLQLVKKDNTQILPIVDKYFDFISNENPQESCHDNCECNDKIKVDQEQQKHLEKDDIVKLLQSYTQYVEITPSFPLPPIPPAVKGKTPPKRATRSNSQDCLPKCDTSNQKRKKAQTNQTIKQETELKEKKVNFEDLVCETKCDCVESLIVPNNSLVSVCQSDSQLDVHRRKRSCRFCKTIFEYIEERKKNPSLEPPKEYMDKVDDCQLCRKFLEFLNLQVWNPCCSAFRCEFSCNREQKNKSSCLCRKKYPKNNTSIHLNKIRAIEKNENKQCLNKPNLANGTHKPEVYNPCEENIRHNLKKQVDQNTETQKLKKSHVGTRTDKRIKSCNKKTVRLPPKEPDICSESNDSAFKSAQEYCQDSLGDFYTFNEPPELPPIDFENEEKPKQPIPANLPDIKSDCQSTRPQTADNSKRLNLLEMLTRKKCNKNKALKNGNFLVITSHSMTCDNEK